MCCVARSSTLNNIGPVVYPGVLIGDRKASLLALAPLTGWSGTVIWRGGLWNDLSFTMNGPGRIEWYSGQRSTQYGMTFGGGSSWDQFGGLMDAGMTLQTGSSYRVYGGTVGPNAQVVTNPGVVIEVFSGARWEATARVNGASSLVM